LHAAVQCNEYWSVPVTVHVIRWRRLVRVAAGAVQRATIAVPVTTIKATSDRMEMTGQVGVRGLG